MKLKLNKCYIIILHLVHANIKIIKFVLVKMKKSLHLYFKLVAAIILSVVLSNENTLVENDIAYIEVLEYEIEEEEKVDSFSNDPFSETEFIKYDGPRKDSPIVKSIFRLKSEYPKIKIDTHYYPTERSFTSPVPSYILNCSLVVYA